MDEIKYTMTRESITFMHGGKSHSVQKGMPNYAPIREALLAENWEEVPKHLTIGKSLEEWAKGEFKVEGSTITFKGEVLPHNLHSRIVAMAQSGSDPTPLFRFWERLQRNPSMRSVEQLWNFLQHSNIPLTTNGTFYAYKGVKHDYKDAHSGTIDNSPGAVNRMPRNKISDDPQKDCHFGFHVGALDYARGFSQLVVVCEVDPEHVVCVPYHLSSQKMRVCEYKVVGNYGGPLPSIVIVPDTEVEEFVETDKDDFEKEPDQNEEEEKEDEASEDPDGDKDEGDDEGQPAELNEDEPKDPFDHEHPEDEKDPLEVTDEDADRERVREEKKRKKVAKEERQKARETREVDPDKRAAKKGFDTFTKMDLAKLMEQSLDDLRQYAGKGLDIVGASKIAGGKAELVKRIFKVRKRESK
jgi:hypothetical protein